MAGITAIDGTRVTDEMINTWCDALDRDEWPDGWQNVGDIVEGMPEVRGPATQTLSVKVPTAMKHAVDKKAKSEGVSTSSFVRAALAKALL